MGGVAYTGIASILTSSSEIVTTTAAKGMFLSFVAFQDNISYGEVAEALYSVSFFCNLQILMSSFILVAHFNSVPMDCVRPLFLKHFGILASVGWLQAPALITLGVFLNFFVWSDYSTNI